MAESVTRARRFLAARFGADVAALERVGQGEWSEAFAFQLDERELVVRFGAYVADFEKDRRAAAWTSPALPIPRVLEVGRADGGYYAIAERAHGAPLDDVDGVDLRTALPSLLAALDAMRAVDLSGTTGYGAWAPGGAAPLPTWRAALLDVAHDRPGSRTAGWRARLEAFPNGGRAFEAALSHLRTLLDACPESRHLVHGDLLNRNVLVDAGRVSAVLDWGNALYGDFLYDLAWLCFWQPWYPAWGGVDIAAAARQRFADQRLDVPDLEARLRCYQVHIGLDSLTYNAFKGRWATLDEVARHTLRVARGEA